METQSIFNLMGLVGIGVVGWFARTIYDAQKKLGEDLNDHKVKVAEDYTHKADFKEAVAMLSQEMKDGFNRLFERLDSKADKQ